MTSQARANGRISPSATPSDARERIVRTAYSLFCRHGIRAVGVDTIIDQSGVAKMTMYRHFRSKDDLVLEVMRRRERLWTDDWLVSEVHRRANSPSGRLLAIFDVFDEWFHRRTFEGCLFVNVLLEIDDRRSAVHTASRRHLANIRRFIEELASEAGIDDPQGFALQWHILMKGSIIQATENDKDAARRAKAMGALLLAAHGLSTS
jgi:AcrR family transcriptional regulator